MQRESEFGNTNSLSDLMLQPWLEPEPSLEDKVIEDLDQEQTIQRIKHIVQGMNEPHRTVFELVYLTEPTHQRSPTGNGVSTGWTFLEVGKKYGRSTTWVRQVLDEAMEYLRGHLAM